MKKRVTKLQLHRETLRALDRSSLDKVVGASELGMCISDLPGMCDPSANSECVSGCVVCPDQGPSVYC